MHAALLVLSLILAAPPSPSPASPTAEVESLLATHGFGRPLHDPKLDQVAGRLTERLSGPLGGSVTASQGAADDLAFALAAAQISDAQVFPFTLRHRAFADFTARLPVFLGRLDRTKPPTVYGLATYGKGGSLTTTLLLVHRGAVLNQPIPRQSEPGGWIPIQGELLRGYFRPRVLVSPPGGQYGPVVLNNAEVSVGVPVPVLPVTRLDSGAPVGPPAFALLRLVNEQRAAHDLPVLRLWPELGVVAQDYAAELDRTRVLVHATAASGNLTTRLQTRGLRFTQAAENLADAANARQALGAFMASPGHKRNLLDPGLTHAGVGVVGRYFVLAMVRLGP